MNHKRLNNPNWDFRLFLLPAAASLLWIALLLWATATQPLFAHGGGDLTVNSQPTGPFQLSVWVNPPTALTNKAVHITVGVADQATDMPILDATILISVFAAGAETAVSPLLTAFATSQQATNKLFYETDFTLTDPGTYSVVIDVSNNAGDGQVTFDLVVRPASNRWYAWFAIAALGLVALWAIGQGWQARQTAVSPPQHPHRSA